MKAIIEELNGRFAKLDMTKESNRHVITSRQGVYVDTTEKKHVLNMCANNYLGLAGSDELEKAGAEGLQKWGYGVAAGRNLCGTQAIHKELEGKLSAFLGMEDTMLFLSAFDANEGIFSGLLGAKDAIISDELNHASIIDGVRLSKAKRLLYKNNNMEDLRAQLETVRDCPIKLIVTDGVFSMEGTYANLPAICELAEEYNALVMVDDAHATGFVGPTGRGTHEYNNVMGRVDIITGTLGKALGGACGGFISSSEGIIGLLRKGARPYTFSNSLPPVICAGTIYVLDQLMNSAALVDKLRENTVYYKEQLRKNGFEVNAALHPIVPVLFYDEDDTRAASRMMWERGVYMSPTVYPVVAKGKARLRTQVTVAHTKEDIDYAVQCFVEVREELARKKEEKK